MRTRLSLNARLLLVAVVTGVAALLFASMSIGHVLERFVLRGLDQTLDTQIAILERAVLPDGRLDRAKVVSLPGFDTSRGGWIWRVRDPAGEWSSGGPALAENDIRLHHTHGPEDIRPGEGRTADGRPMHLRRLEAPFAGGVLEIIAAAPHDLVDRPLRAAQGTLLLSLALLGLGLAVSTWIQLRYGLRPVRALYHAIAEVRLGRLERLPVDQPRELRPLAAEVNALVDQNAAGLDHARRHVANLAHGLKTPLATLSLRLSREDVSPETRALVDQLDARIAHHLRRARAAAPAVGQRASASVAETLADLVQALRHIHAARGLAFDIEIDASQRVAVDRQDLEEILGNLLDNGCRHASTTVRTSGSVEGQILRILIEDDGPGLTEAEAEAATQAGVRLDESGVGYGFGLSITQELVELYGGTLALGRSAKLGGLAAILSLPVAFGGA